MKHVLTFFSIALLAVMLATAAVVSGATSTAEAYWQKVLPNTPMPSSLRHAFKPNLAARKGNQLGGTTVGAGGKGVGVNKMDGIYLFIYAASTEQLHDPKLSLFFLEKDLRTGNKLNMIFSNAVTESILGDGKGNRLSLDEKNLPEILKEFSLDPESEEARGVKETIQTCNGPANKGEDKYCAASLESMINFATSKLGTHVLALETTVDKETSNQVYTIAAGVQEMKGQKSVACHQLTFVYPVYYCHEIAATSAYVVPLVGNDGSKVKAVALCHKDTSSWNPKHLAFQLLKVKPGSAPVCHLLFQNHVVWVQN